MANGDSGVVALNKMLVAPAAGRDDEDEDRRLIGGFRNERNG